MTSGAGSAAVQGQGNRRGFRPDIQAMRALAVVLVLVYHFWPTGPLPGGYVGVDVFFVISGFLISGHLVESQAKGTLRLREFWAKRARRLLPASLLVILVVVVVTLLTMPLTMWRSTFEQAVASALYLQNIALTLDSVDYLAADGVASPLQHYWSLSLEEQFYVFWPVLLLLALAVGRRLHVAKYAVPTAIMVVSAVSFVYSVTLTASDPGPAYFVPFTRAWEFGAGALVYLLSRRIVFGGWLSGITACGGAALIIASAAVFDPGTPFPGYSALMPVAGAAIMILAAHNHGLLGRLMAARPIQHLGDISYSLYLWHWPATVFAFTWIASAGVRIPEPVVAVVLFGLTVPLSSLSKRYVEDRFSRGVRSEMTPLRTLVVMGTATGIVAVSAAGGLALRDRAVTELSTTLAEHAEDECVGARSLLDPECDVGEVILPPVLAEDDLAETYELDCQAGARSPNVTECTFGEGDVTVALVGDSHATSWFPAIQRIAEDQGWQVDTYLKSSCRWAGLVDYGTREERESCVAWNEEVDRVLTDETPDIVLTAYYARTSGASDETLTEGFLESWGPVAEAGATIIAMQDSPALSSESFTCLFESNRDPRDCAIEPSRQDETVEALQSAVDGLDGVSLVSLEEMFMDDEGRVRTEVGGLVIWRDSHHVAATYAATLADPLWERLEPILESNG